MDDRLRALERARGGSPEAEAAWLAARLRAGLSSAELLRAAALAGHAASARALDLEAQRPHLGAFTRALEGLPGAARSRLALAAARAVLPGAQDAWVRGRCEAIVAILQREPLDVPALGDASGVLGSRLETAEPAAVALSCAADFAMEEAAHTGDAFRELLSHLETLDPDGREGAWRVFGDALAGTTLPGAASGPAPSALGGAPSAGAAVEAVSEVEEQAQLAQQSAEAGKKDLRGAKIVVSLVGVYVVVMATIISPWFAAVGLLAVSGLLLRRRRRRA